MSIHIFKYSIKSLLSDKMAAFWTLFFPIILSTLFNLAFQNLLEGESFEKIKIAIISETEMPSELTSALESSDMFLLSTATEEQAKAKLNEGKITGYLKNDGEIELIISEAGISQSISKIFLDNYVQISASINNVLVSYPELLATDFFDNVDFSTSFTKTKEINKSTDLTVIYFYSLLAMTCLMAGIAGCHGISTIQANQSSVASRLNVSPTKKLKAVISTISAYYLYQLTAVLFVILYISKVLKVDFGDSIGLILLLCVVACFTGIMFGTMIGAISTKRIEIKTSILLAIIMVGCFLSGMMAIQMKYLVQNKFPLIAYLNMSNLITDGFYALYYYDTYNRYFLNLSILAGFGAVFMVITYLVLRRQKYASI